MWKERWEAFDPKWKFFLAFAGGLAAVIGLFEFLEKNDWPRPAFRPSIDRMIAKELGSITTKTEETSKLAIRATTQMVDTNRAVISAQETLLQWRLDEVNAALEKDPDNRWVKERKLEYERHITFLRDEQKRLERRKEELDR